MAIAIGNAAIDTLNQWPKTGEGREVKAAAERMTRLLAGTHDKRDVRHAFEILDQVIDELRGVIANIFFRGNLAKREYRDPKWTMRSLGDYCRDLVDEYTIFAAQNRPALAPLAPGEELLPLAIDLRSNRPKRSSRSPVAELRASVPRQRLAPMQVEFAEKKFRVRHQPAVAAQYDARNAEAARDRLLSEADGTVADLLNTNAEPRIIAILSDIRRLAEHKRDIIQLGLATLTLQRFIARSDDELPIVVISRLEALHMSIEQYVAQFPDWRKFSRNADDTKPTISDAEKVHAAGAGLLKTLEQEASLVDPQLPHTLKLILEAIKDPKRSTRRAFYGAITTMENILAAFADVITSSTKKAGGVIITGAIILSVAAAAAAMSASSARLLGTNWLAKAAEILPKAIDNGR